MDTVDQFDLSPPNELWVTEDRKGLTGTMVYVPRLPSSVFYLPYRKDVGVVEGMAVLPERQGEGFGGALLQKAEERAREDGKTHLFLVTLPFELPTAIAMYQGRGYQAVNAVHLRTWLTVYVRAL